MEIPWWFTALVHLQEASAVVALIIFIITPKAGRKNFRVIGFILACVALAETSSWIAVALLHVNPNPIGSFYDLVVVVAFYFFYKGKIGSQKIKTSFLVLTIVYLVFAIINLFFIQGIMKIPSYTMTFGCVVLITFATTYFRVLSRELPRSVYVRLPIFWINCAVITYFSVTLPIYLITDYIYITLKLSLIPLWTVHNAVGVIYYAFLAIGLWRNRILYIPQSSLKT
jgi:hypothetical protein